MTGEPELLNPVSLRVQGCQRKEGRRPGIREGVGLVLTSARLQGWRYGLER